MAITPKQKQKTTKDRKITLEPDRPRNLWKKVTHLHGSVSFAKSLDLTCDRRMKKGGYLPQPTMYDDCVIQEKAGHMCPAFFCIMECICTPLMVKEMVAEEADQ